MNDFLKWLGKVMLTGVIWVFLLSITVGGRSLFSYANDILVQNALVQYVDEELADLWSKVKKTARVTFSEMTKVEEKA